MAMKVTGGKVTWRVEELLGEGVTCSKCKGEGCKACVRIHPLGVRLELECGTRVSYTFRTATYKVVQPGAPKEYRSGRLTGETTEGREFGGLRVTDFVQSFGGAFTGLVRREVVRVLYEWDAEHPEYVSLKGPLLCLFRG